MWRGWCGILLVCFLALATAIPFEVREPEKKVKEDPPVVLVRDTISQKPKMEVVPESDMEAKYPDPLNDANQEHEQYPLLPQGELAWKDNFQVVAPPLQVDNKAKDSEGVPRDGVIFAYNITQSINPMEVKTPLYDATPCLDLPIKVSIPALENDPNASLPHLPTRFGCSHEKELSREKASFEVSITEYTDDIVDFSLQLVSMGDETCGMKVEDGFNKILWHVTGINASKTGITRLVEGASHDARTLLGGVEQPNQYLEEYYSGPCPVPGATECFRLKVLGHKPDGKSCVCGYQDFLFYRPSEDDELAKKLLAEEDGAGVPDLETAQPAELMDEPKNQQQQPRRNIIYVDASDEPDNAPLPMTEEPNSAASSVVNSPEDAMAMTSSTAEPAAEVSGEPAPSVFDNNGEVQTAEAKLKAANAKIALLEAELEGYKGKKAPSGGV